jgi:sortase (surface protein transpeptidase)
MMDVTYLHTRVEDWFAYKVGNYYHNNKKNVIGLISIKRKHIIGLCTCHMFMSHELIVFD